MEEIDKEKSKKKSDALSFALGELCFILLPFIVMLIIFAYKGNLKEIAAKPEWSMASILMFGQIIIRSMHTIGKISSRHNYPVFRFINIATFFAFILLLGLTPSLIILAIIYTAMELPLWIIISQIAIFAVAVFIFTMFNRLMFEIEESDDERMNKK